MRESGSRQINHLKRVGMIARWRPVHRGHASVLCALCDRADEALIGIGSANRYNARNPFTLDETRQMIQLVLADRENYQLIPVPDLDDGPRWREMVIALFGHLDLFVTDNPYVENLLAKDYRLIKPVDLIPADERVAIDGMMVRREMARGNDWRELVPDPIAEFITAQGLDTRFRREFGLETLAMETIIQR